MEITPSPAPIKKNIADPVALIERAWKTYKLTFKKLWVLFLLGGIGNVGLRYSGSSNSTSAPTGTVGTSPASLSSLMPHISAEILIPLIVVGVLLAAFFLWSKIALFKSISDIRKSEYQGVKSAYSKSLKLFFPFILISIMTSLSFAGGLILFIVPGILLYGYLLFVQIEFFDKDKRGFAALLGSWSLMGGYWIAVVWRVFVMAFLIGLVAFVGVLGSVLVGGILAFLASLGGTPLLIVVVSILALAVLGLIFLVLEPVAILMMFEMYYEISAVRADENPEALHALDGKRKTKLIVSMCIGVLAVIVFFFIGAFVYQKIADLSASNSSLNISHSKVFTYEDPADYYTIDYPTTWRVMNEYATSSPAYIHSVSFSPVSTKNSSQADATTSLVIVSELSSRTLDQVKQRFVSSVLETKDSEIHSLEVSSSTFGYFPSYDITFVEKDFNPGTPFSASSTIESKVYTKLIIRGSYLYMITFSTDLASFDARFKEVSAMIDSWYLYYTQAMTGQNVSYINTDYGVQLSYPKTWVQVASRPDNGIIAEFKSFGGEQNSKIIAVLTEKYSGNLEVYKNKLMSRMAGNATPVTLGGLPGFQVVRTPQETLDAGYVITDFTQKDGNIYAVLFQGVSPEDPIIPATINSFAFSSSTAFVNDATYTTYENRRFGFAVTVPKKWTPYQAFDLTSLAVYSYVIIGDAGANDPFKGLLQFSIPDSYYAGKNYSVEKYRDDSILSWKKGSDNVKDFTLLETGTTTINGLPAAYHIGKLTEYKGDKNTLPVEVKTEQLFVNKDGIIRWMTYTDDTKDFDAHQAEVTKAMHTLILR